ncbi:MAG: hypothetical protein HYY59_02075 [Candidatus Omnitrophica bacterium]|nr:hypothetical protein [Candidatus Omnitrophota bacterium]MBI3020771.1 hypothetical protein [Candidatus Omnitrophota bacterium]
MAVIQRQAASCKLQAPSSSLQPVACSLKRPPRMQGQSAIEYAVLIAVAVAMLVAMSVYTQRALAGRWRMVADAFGYGRQYEHGVTVVNGQ